jgi:hypothetical protein
MKASWVVLAAVLLAPPAAGAQSEHPDEGHAHPDEAAEALAPAPGLDSVAEAALADVRRRFGAEAAILAIEVHPEETAIAVQDPALPAHVDRHRYDGEGRRLRPEPVAVGRSMRELRARLFRLREVDASVLPALIAAAPAEVDTERGEVTHVVLDRREGSGEYPVWGAPRWRVHVAGPRGGGSVEYALDGTRKRVYRW